MVEKFEELKVRQYESLFGIKQNQVKRESVSQGPLSKHQIELLHKHSLAKIFYEVCDNPNSKIMELTERMKI
jgi:hypothetical protein